MKLASNECLIIRFTFKADIKSNISFMKNNDSQKNKYYSPKKSNKTQVHVIVNTPIVKDEVQIFDVDSVSKYFHVKKTRKQLQE
jgi:hypothetical protein